MFEKFFNSPKSPEDAERKIQKIVSKELSIGINGPSIFNAFKSAQRENTERSFGLTNNHLLNIVKDSATGLSSVIEDSLYGGPEQTLANINSEIERLRRELTGEEKGS